MSAGGNGDAFSAELAGLKRRGSAILVVSDGGGPGACRDLLGSDGEGRRRVLVRADEFDELPVPGDEPVVVDSTASDARSAAGFEPDSVGRHVAGGRSVDTVATAVTNEVERIGTDGLEPGELRICLGPLDPLLGRNDVEPVAVALHEVLEAVRSARGMGHAHLSACVDDPVLERLRPLFDVTVETRSTPDGIHQQRWRLHEAGIDTGWLQMQTR